MFVVFGEILMLFFRFLFTCNVGVALTGIGVAPFEVGVARATPKVYKPPPLALSLELRASLS